MEGGAEVGDPAAPGTRPPGAAPGVLPQSGRATARSPTFLKPLERHLRDGGWGWGGSFSSEPTGPTLWSFFPPPGRPRASPRPLPPNDQLPATLLPGAARGWLAGGREETAARITSA